MQGSLKGTSENCKNGGSLKIRNKNCKGVLYMRIFCFSGTGNSYSIASGIGERFSVKPELITSFKGVNTIEAADTLIGIVAPIYLNDIPKMVKEFILKMSFINSNTYVFAVLTSSSGRNKNGFKNINLALAQHEAKLALAYDISMPSSFRERTDMDSLLNAVPEKIVEISKAIEDKRINYTSNSSTMLPKNFTKLSLMYRPLSRMSITENCVGCGLCCKLCPTDNFTVQNGKVVRGNNCIACTACANWCPHQAISSRMLKGQYHHPDVIANDLLSI
jgi:ferredoxin